MNPRAFTTNVENWHRRWLGSLFSLTSSTNGGIDLYDDTIGVELKSRYTKYNHSFAVHAKQTELFLEENPTKKLYWAFLLYDLSRSPAEIGSQFDIESYVTKREVWFTSWDWIRQFPIHNPKTGPYQYISIKKLPAEDEVYTRKDEIIHLPKNSLLEERFINLKK